MPAKRYSVEQIVAKLREAEKHQAQGLTIPQSCKRLGISEQTFYRWRIKYGALKEDEVQRLKALEQENSRLKKPGGRSLANRARRRQRRRTHDQVEAKERGGAVRRLPSS
jgi:transposase